MTQAEHTLTTQANPSLDLVKLIRKLRWIGLEEEAHELELAVSKFPPEMRDPVVAQTSSTD